MLASGGQPFFFFSLSPSMSVTVTAAHISSHPAWHFCTLNDLIGIRQPDQNATITSYLALEWSFQRENSCLAAELQSTLTFSRSQTLEWKLLVAFLSGSIMSQPKLFSVLISSCRRYQSHMQLLFLLWGFCHWFHFVLAYVKCIVKPLQCRQMCHIQMQPQHIMYRITTSRSIKFFFLMSLFWNIMFVFTFWDFLFARRDLWFLQHVTPDSVLHLVPISRSEKHIEAVRFLGFLHPMRVIWSEVDIFRPVSSHLALNASRAISCDHSSLPHSLCKYTPTPSFTGTNKCVFSTRNNYLNV